MLFIVLGVLFLGVGFADDNKTYYETLTGNTINLEELKKHVKENTTFFCVGKYAPCDPKELRRLDGTCNNLKYPTKGPAHTPYITELPLMFDKDYEPVKQSNGKKLEPREVRTATLFNAEIPDQQFTTLVVNLLLFGFDNIGSIHDTVNYVHWRPYCCDAKGKNDSQCHPINVPADDTVHQFSGIRCLNNTKPITFQSVGCTRNKNTKPERINSAQNFLSLGKTYGEEDGHRTYIDGLIKIEEENGKLWPLSLPLEAAKGICLLNQFPQESRCHNSVTMNALFGLNFFGIIFWRHHNFLAKKLKEVNPSWNDDKLFFTARELNIAHLTQIYYYELLPAIIGKRNLINEGVISRNGGFRDVYDENLIPQQSLEYSAVMRWVHTIQPGHIELYDDDGYYQKKFRVSNLTMHTGMFPLDNNMEGFCAGSFRQPAAKFDHMIDPVLSENGLEGVQRAFDLAAADLLKDKLFGFQPYIAYRKLCSGKTYKTFEDLSADMEPENIELLKKAFPTVKDVPLLAGIWLEKKIPGGAVPRTFACIKMKQLRRFPRYDRFWYERPSRPGAFTQQQLQQIRRASIARLMCDVGDGVTRIQPNAFLREGFLNRITKCSRIRSLDFRAWKDSQTSQS